MSSSPHPVSWAALLVGGVALVASAASMLGQPKYGYTEVARLLEAYPPALEMETGIQTEIAPAKAKVEQQQKLVEGVKARIDENRDQLSETDKAVLDIQLLKARQQQLALTQQLDQLETKLRQDRMKPVLQELDKSLKAFGEAEGYEMIWTATSAGNLVYTSAASDVTDDLLAWISTQNP